MPVKLFVGNISNSSEKDLLGLFQKYGPVKECSILGKFGFVHMENDLDGTKAIKELNGMDFNGQVINVMVSKKREDNNYDNNGYGEGEGDRGGYSGGRGGGGRGGGGRGGGGRANPPGKTKIFIGNIDPCTTNDELRLLFEAYGTVAEADVCGSFGFVHMTTLDSALHAIKALQGYELNGNEITVELSTRNTQGRKKALEEAEYEGYAQMLPSGPMRGRGERGRGGFPGALGNPYMKMHRGARMLGPTYGATSHAYQSGGLPPVSKVTPASKLEDTDTFAKELLRLYLLNPVAFDRYARDPQVQLALNLDAPAATTSETMFPAETFYENDFKYYDSNESSSTNLANRLFTCKIWQDEDLMRLNDKLNSKKAELSDLDIIAWQRHTQKRSLGQAIVAHIRKYFSPEMCTQAWCKMLEILNKFPQLSPSPHSDVFSSVHLCEAPGAFVACLNYYLHNIGFKGKWDWIANSLNPHYEGNDYSTMIATDIFIVDTFKHWHFGVDNTGDITILQNLNSFVLHCKQSDSFPFDLVTCDGSIDCSLEPGRQEESVAHLKLCEVVAGLQLLKINGCFVLKVFTMFTSHSISFMYFLFLHFQQLNLFKPLTSKSGNSEIYVVAQGFKGIEEQVILKLMQHLDLNTFNTTPIFAMNDISPFFMNMHRKYCYHFAKLQIDHIQCNLSSYKTNYVPDELLNVLKDLLVDIFMKQCQLKHISKDQLILPNYNLAKVSRQRIKYHSKRKHKGSLANRCNDAQKDFQTSQNLSTYKQELTIIPHLKGIKNSDFYLEFGKPVKLINSSCFCDRKLLTLLKEIEIKDQNNIDMTDFTNYYSSIINSNLKGRNLVAYDDLNFQHLRLTLNQTCLLLSDLKEFGKDGVENMFVILPISAASDLDHSMNAHQYLLQLIQILLIATPSATVALPCPLVLTRVAAALFFFIYSFFKEIHILRSNKFPLMIILAFSFTEIEDSIHLSLINLKAQLLKSFESSSETTHCIVSIISMNILLEKKLYANITTLNNEYLKMRIDYLLGQSKTNYLNESN